jgi:hypothetical protein
LEKIKQEKDSFELGILCNLYTDYKFGEYWSNYLDKNKNDYYPIIILESELLFGKFIKNKQ